eukprot:scaffold1080_cov109-Skeletonema_dohrnii-CCMP3373.AAC.1
MANYYRSLEAVERGIHSVRYDMAVYRDSGGRLRCLIRSPTTLKRRRYKHAMLEPCGTSYSQREIRYGAREMSWRPSQMPHQVTYDVEATPIQACNA